MSGSESISAFFGLLSWASAIGLFFIACLAYLSRIFERNPSSVALLLGGTFWLWFQASANSVSDPGLMQVFFYSQYLSLALIPPFLLGTCFRFSGRTKPFRQRAVRAVAFLTVLFLLLVLTDTFAHWFFLRLTPEPSTHSFQRTAGPGYYAFLAFLFVSLAVGLLELGSRHGTFSPVDKKRSTIIVVALAVPFAAGLTDVFHVINVAGLSLAPASCLISALLVVFGIGRVRLMTPHQPEAHELVVEQLGDPVMVLGSSETVDWINQSARAFFEGTPWRPGVPLSRFSPRIHDLLPVIRESDETTFEKDSRQYQIKSTPILNHESGPRALVLIFREVTQLKAKERLEAEVLELQEAQGELVKLVQEKEVLIQEVHHRVKNNLQTVISLINLQSRRLPDDSAMKGLLNDMRTRVRTISLVHEQIYRSGFTSGTDLRDYLKDLVAEIASLYTVPGCSVSVQPTEHPVFVTMDFMLDFGLVINELVTNAFKHGVLIRGSGEIVIALNPEHGILRFSVTDTGPGFPQRGDGERTSTLGLSVVRAILKKYKAELAIEQNGGTKILISVPWEES